MACAWNENPAFIYIHIPKTGGSSFMSKASSATREIKRQCPSITISAGHKPLLYLARQMDISKYFKFSIIRNPFDRFVSLWVVQELATGVSFDAFINLTIQRKYGWFPLKPQSYWISDKEGNILTDCLIRFEKYTQGIKKVLKKLSLPSPKLPHLRKSLRQDDYRIYYKTDSQIEKVSKIYSTDLKNFGYSF